MSCASLTPSGRTVVCVHHDLQTVAEYFDHVLLLNMRVVAAGPVGDDASRPRTCSGPTAAGWRPADAAERAQKHVAEAGAACDSRTAPPRLLPTLPCAGYNTAVVVDRRGLLGVAAGMIGSFALLRKRAMMSDALSHATLPGIALAFLVATALGMKGGALPVLLTGARTSGVLARRSWRSRAAPG